MEFEWDSGNQIKSFLKHGIAPEESEQVFAHPYVIRIDETHSKTEVRFEIIGVTNSGRALYVIFTTRKEKIRIVSARQASKSERKLYEET